VIGRHLGHYVVLTELASGGMGDVYVAQDTRLDRRVALKLPRGEVSASVDRLALLQREARAAAALNHPNIVHLYSVEEADGLIFITMELVQGRTLREILTVSAPLSLGRTIAFAGQIAEGLACAHAAGILHRDLKPGNVMVTDDDRIKILDFGVAKFLKPAATWDPEAATTIRESTRGQTTVGTIGYMSPEQALGQSLDSRSDLFALGVILFEMATGRPPFDGATPAVVFDRLLNRRPPSALTLNATLPADLIAIIDRALEKDPARRYRSAADFLEELRRIEPAGGRAPAATRVAAGDPVSSSIVVLPFVDMSPQKDQEYFCHGITEEIINTLTSVPGLRVISRTSAFAFQGQEIDVTEIGRRLRVGTALEGSVRKAGDRVRVAAQLVDTEGGHQLWSRRFDRQLADVFAIQDEIATTIVSELRTGLVGDPPTRRVSLDAAAHDAYLKGMYARNKWTVQSVQQAMDDFRDAIALDSGFAPAWAGLAESHVWLYSGVGLLPAGKTVPAARLAVDKALQLDPGLADAYKVRGLIAMNHDWDRAGSEESLARALELGPGSAAAHLWNAWRLALLERRYDHALDELAEAERLDPLDLQTKTLIGYVHYFHHDFDRAAAQFEKVLALEPSFAFAHYALADACRQRREFERSFLELERAIALGGRSVNHVGVLGYACGLSGNHARARALLQELMMRAEHGYVSAMWIALVHLGLSDLDGLFHWLDRAFEERDGSLILVTAAVEFDPVRADPRFKSLLERMGLGYLGVR
jgi:eukaryotic-like serine/threonine-protein kinase